MRRSWIDRGKWPCKWICCPDTGPAPLVTAYRREFSLREHAVIRVHVSADERYELFLDGERVGRGPERGDRENWFYETYDLDLQAGEHVIVARVWSLGAMSPYAQMSVRPGFILAPEGNFIDLLGTGVASWQA
ncbi:MAG: alpha-L-rhamnosidase, partial [Armatimonadota bacterium]